EMPKHVLDIKSLPETKRMEYKPQEGLYIGASVTVNQVAESNLIQEKFAALAQAASSLASYQLRNRATLVGNICNASPGADLSAPLLIYEAKVHIANLQGGRVVDINEFFTGVKKTVLKQGELVIGVSMPDVDAGDTGIFLKKTRVKGHDLGIAGVAMRLTADKKVIVAMSAVAPTPIRLTKLEEFIGSQPLTAETAALAGKEVRKIIKPISDVRSSAEYRLHVSGVMVKRALTQLMDMGGKRDVR
ncbi:MAG: FAD binding domain-containing protein, partial [Sporomusa sp.]